MKSNKRPSRLWRRLLLRFVNQVGKTWRLPAAFALCAFTACPSFGREAVYFKTGFSLEVDSYTLVLQTIVLHLDGGTLEFDAAQVARIEKLPDIVKLVAPPTVAESRPPETILSEAAYLQGLDEDFVGSVAKVESGLHQAAVSKKGAIGLMQLMPSTAARLRVDPNRARENAQGGAMYLRDLLIRYHGNSALALAAYNAGPGTVAKFGGVPPYEETRRYISLVLHEYSRRVRLRKTTALLASKRSERPSPQAGSSRITSTNGSE